MATVKSDSGTEYGSIDRPLVTFVLLAFNQEEFISDAVEGALSQTYSPLQIFFSDDCSTDRTFEIMEDLVSKYEGPHQVVITQNKTNLGVGEHINTVVRNSKGELIVAAAGDDVSLPHRTTATVNRWLDCDRKPCSIYSRNIVINSDGVQIGENGSCPKQGSLVQKLLRYMDGTLGCSHTWSRKVFESFGPLLPNTVCEDRVIPFRSELMGGIEFIEEPLVKYRVHDSNLSHFHGRDKKSVLNMAIEINRRNLNILKNYLADLSKARDQNLLSATECNSIRLKLEGKITETQDKICFLQGDTAKKLSLIRSSLLGSPRLALRWIAILLFPNLYVKYKYKKPAQE